MKWSVGSGYKEIKWFYTAFTVWLCVWIIVKKFNKKKIISKFKLLERTFKQVIQLF